MGVRVYGFAFAIQTRPTKSHEFLRVLFSFLMLNRLGLTSP